MRPFERVEPPEEFHVGRSEVIERLDRSLQRVLGTSPPAMPSMRLVVSDVEGCLNYNPLTYDHAVLSKIREANEQASWDNGIPFLTLCTGRQAPFVDAFAGFLAVRVPIIFEGGCGLFFPTEPPGLRHAWHPNLRRAEQSGELDLLTEVVGRVATETGARRSLSKERLLTFHAPPHLTIEQLVECFNVELEKAGLAAEITRSANAVDISVPGITKGAAISWLLDSIVERWGVNVSLSQVAGIGDAPNDLAFLQVVGMSVAPKNADDLVKRAVHTVSGYTDSKAVAELICVGIDRNTLMESQ